MSKKKKKGWDTIEDKPDESIPEIIKNEKDNYCIRLNGTSDIDWSDLIGSLPNIQFYDYSKVLKRIKKNTLDNYHLTYSASFKVATAAARANEFTLNGGRTRFIKSAISGLDTP